MAKTAPRDLSASGKQWHIPGYDERLLRTLVQRYGISDWVGRLLINRGVNLDTVEAYLDPRLKTLMLDPLLLRDMDRAVERVIAALNQEQSIVAYGDYDVDGACASALLRRYFQALNHPIDLYIPDRLEEGYGAHSEALEALHKGGTQLILMVDCGTTAFEPLTHAKSLGLDVIIFDHHTAQATLPPTAALVNPNRLDENPAVTAQLGALCAAGVAYLFLVALQRALRQQGWFSQRNIPEPNLLSFLDLVALATVCDVMPLTGLNRGFVTQGLKIMRQRQNVGLKALTDVAGIAEAVNPYHLGFILGPRINAGGRVGQADMGSRLLTTDDTLQAKEWAERLHVLNQQRQEIEKLVLEEAIEQVESSNLSKNPFIVVGGEG